MKIIFLKSRFVKSVILLLSFLFINTFTQAGINYRLDTLEEIQKQYDHLIKKIHNVKIDKFEEALRIVIDADNIFEPNSKTLKSLDENSIKPLLEYFKKYTNNEFIVTIHSDSDGDDNLNLEISKKRASELKSYFQKNGIRTNRFKCIGLGETQALNFKKNDLIKTNNRIEILVLVE